MTVEELLEPRFKVIANYPGSLYEVGDVIPTYESCRAYVNDEKDCLTDYPALFRRMGWWEERKESDLPMYLKWYDKDARPSPYVHKVKAHFNKSHPDWRTHKIDRFASENGIDYGYSAFLPATEEEYLKQ